MALYFRIRPTGATVFRPETSARTGRLDLVPLASVQVATGTVRPVPRAQVTEDEAAEIAAWVAARQAELAARPARAAAELAERINEVANWVQTGAGDAEVAALSDPLLLAMHDLRAALVRRLADAGPPLDPPGPEE